MNCSDTGRLQGEYLAGTLSRGDERKCDRHLDRCDDCRKRFAQIDPLRIFRQLESPAHSANFANFANFANEEKFWARFWPGIRAEIEKPPSRATFWGFARRPVPAFAFAFMAVLLIGGWFLLSRPSLPEKPQRRAGSILREDHRPSVRNASTGLPTIDSLSSPNARVYNFLIEEAGEPPTEVILIFDESIDL